MILIFLIEMQYKDNTDRWFYKRSGKPDVSIGIVIDVFFTSETIYKNCDCGVNSIFNVMAIFGVNSIFVAKPVFGVNSIFYFNTNNQRDLIVVTRTR